MQDEAVAFVEQVKDRGDAFREDAASVRVGGTQNMERVATADLPKGPAGPINFDEIVAGASTNIGAGAGEAPPLIVFASLSMPPKALRTLIADTSRAGAVFWFRGFRDTSMPAFLYLVRSLGTLDVCFSLLFFDPRSFCLFLFS